MGVCRVTREPGAEPRYRVYVVRLKKKVLRSRKFLRENPNYRKGKPCVYVGQTSQTPEARFNQHLSDPRKGSTWVKRYGKDLFSWAYEDHPELPTRDQALDAERDLAEELRGRGWGVWYR
jgi:hypothetical protein